MDSPIEGWSKAKWKGWIISLLRRGTLRYPPRNEVLKAARTEKKINKATGRMAQHYQCCACKDEFPLSKMRADHIEPVVCPHKGFVDWNTYIERMFCVKENLQAICIGCHKMKSDEEKEKRKKK